jgi:hypothetical protein
MEVIDEKGVRTNSNDSPSHINSSSNKRLTHQNDISSDVFSIDPNPVIKNTCNPNILDMHNDSSAGSIHYKQAF